jgi:hypothetical protein
MMQARVSTISSAHCAAQFTPHNVPGGRPFIDREEAEE